jgi:hypothetical protein
MENSVKEKKAKNLAKGNHPTLQNKSDRTRKTTIVPDNGSGKPGPSSEDSSNVGQGPAVENL